MVKRAGISKQEAIARISQVEETRAKEMEREKLRGQIVAETVREVATPTTTTTKEDILKREEYIKAEVERGYKSPYELLAEEEKLEQRRERQKEEDLGFTDTIGKYWDKLWGIPERPDKKVSPIRQMPVWSLAAAPATGGASLLLPSAGPTVEDVYPGPRAEEARGRQIEIYQEAGQQIYGRDIGRVETMGELKGRESKLGFDVATSRAAFSAEQEAKSKIYDYVDTREKVMTSVRERLEKQIQEGKITPEKATSQFETKVKAFEKEIDNYATKVSKEINKKYTEKFEGLGKQEQTRLKREMKAYAEKLSKTGEEQAVALAESRISTLGLGPEGELTLPLTSAYISRPKAKEWYEKAFKAKEERLALREKGIKSTSEKIAPEMETYSAFGKDITIVKDPLKEQFIKLPKYIYTKITRTEEEKKLDKALSEEAKYASGAGAIRSPTKTLAMAGIGAAVGTFAPALGLAVVKGGTAASVIGLAAYKTTGLALTGLYGYGVYKRVAAKETRIGAYAQAGEETAATFGLFGGAYVGAGYIGPAISTKTKLFGAKAEILSQTIQRGELAFKYPTLSKLAMIKKGTPTDTAQAKAFREILTAQKQVQAKPVGKITLKAEGVTSKLEKDLVQYFVKKGQPVSGSSVFRGRMKGKSGADIDVKGYFPKAQAAKLGKYLRSKGYKVKVEIFPEGGRLPGITSQGLVKITTAKGVARVQYSSPSYAKLSPFQQAYQTTARGLKVESPVSQLGRKLEGLYFGKRGKDVQDLIGLTKLFKPGKATTQIRTALLSGKIQVQPPTTLFSVGLYGVRPVEGATTFQRIYQQQVSIAKAPRVSYIYNRPYTIISKYPTTTPAITYPTKGYKYKYVTDYLPRTTYPRQAGYRAKYRYAYPKYTSPSKYSYPYQAYTPAYRYPYKYTAAKYQYQYQYPKYQYQYPKYQYQYQYPKYQYQYDYPGYGGYTGTSEFPFILPGIPFGLDLKGKGKKARVGRKKYGYQFGFTSAVLGIKTRKAPSKTIFTGQEIRPIVI